MKVYKVGDRVQIQPLASDREKYGHPRASIMDNMLQYSNKQATIVIATYIESLGQYLYQIDLDNRYRFWTSKAFRPPKLLKRKQIC